MVGNACKYFIVRFSAYRGSIDHKDSSVISNANYIDKKMVIYIMLKKGSSLYFLWVRDMPKGDKDRSPMPMAGAGLMRFLKMRLTVLNPTKVCRCVGHCFDVCRNCRACSNRGLV